MSDNSIGFGGGCHWCTEAVFKALRGVSQVSQGFVQSAPPNDSFSEAVIVAYNPEAIPLEVLVEIHLRTHSCTSNHKFREKYRSAVYVFSPAQSVAVQNALTELQHSFEDQLVTQVLPHVAFQTSDEKFANYQEKNSEKQFCVRFIDPKLKMLRERYADWVKLAES